MKAILFDLDDTLFDHQYSRRCGLKALQERYPELAAAPLNELENEHERILLSFYYQTLDGSVSLDDARIIRIQRLGERYGLIFGGDEVRRVAQDYNCIYETTRQAVPGSGELLRHLSGRGLKIGVVTNGLADAQEEKLRICGLEPYIDFVLVSETIGIRKPDPGIFKEALRLADAGPTETIFIGDAWDTDIIGATQCGLKTFWLNRYGMPCPETGFTGEIASFIPLDNILRRLFGNHEFL